MSVFKGGYLSLFVGIVLLVLSFFFTSDWGLTAWLTLFSISLVLCTAGIILLMIHLIKQIKIDKMKKM